MIKYLIISIYFIDIIVEVVLIRNKAITKRTEVFNNYDVKNYTLATKMFNDLHESTKEPYYQTICELQLDYTKKVITLLELHKAYTDKISEHRYW